MKNLGSNKKKLKFTSNILGVLAGKGGVGKSTVTAQLALALNNKGLKVGVLDADIYGPSIAHLLPENQPLRTGENQVLPAQSDGISVISAAYFPKGKVPLGVRAPIANQIVAQFIEEVDWGHLDFLLVDFPPGTGDIQVTLMQKLFFNGVVVVTTPEALSLLDVRKSIEMCLQMGAPLLGVVENISYAVFPKSEERHYLFGKGGGKSLAKEFNVPLMAEIPIDQGLNQPGVEKISTPLFEKLEKEVTCLLKKEKRCKIKGIDPYHFSIEWVDGKKTLYSFGFVEKMCLCVECTMQTDKPIMAIQGIEIHPIGNYGLQFRFSQGCSKGIYPFFYLRRLEQ